MEPIGLLVTLSTFRITMKINYEVTRIVKDGDKVGTLQTTKLKRFGCISNRARPRLILIVLSLGNASNESVFCRL